MERVYLLVQDTNDRLPCLLNPETLVLRRQAGVQPRHSATGRLTGAGLADDPLLCTGGGRTELELDLLFDVTLDESLNKTVDVRSLTAPLWDLAENATEGRHRGRPPLVRFLWGKSWDFPGVVVAVAERLDLFTGEGVPQRSWLRLRLLRSSPLDEQPVVARRHLSSAALASLSRVYYPAFQAGVRFHPLVGAGRLDEAGLGLTSEPSVGESLRMASDIVTSAMAATPAGRWVASACQQLEEIIAGIGDHIHEWWEAPSPLGEAIKAGVRKLGEGMATLFSAAKEQIVTTATAVAVQVSSAFRAMKAALVRLADPVEQAIVDALTPMLDNLRPVVQALRQAAAVVATAVRVQVRQIVAGAVNYAESGLRSIGLALRSAGSLISAAGVGAIETLRSGMDKIGSALEAIKQAGKWLVMENIAPVLGAMAAAADVVWAAGKHLVSRTISRTLARLGVAFRNLLEAQEAARLASSRAAKGVLIPAVAGLRAVLERLKVGDIAALGLVNAAWTDLEAGAEALPVPAEPAALEPVSRACAMIREALPALADPGTQVVAVEQVSAALDQVADAAALLADAEEEEAVHLVRLAAEGGSEATEAAEEEVVSARPEVEPIRRRHPVQRERLDQVAFRYYDDPAYWRLLAVFNNIDDPLRLQAGVELRIPPAALVSEGI